MPNLDGIEQYINEMMRAQRAQRTQEYRRSMWSTAGFTTTWVDPYELFNESKTDKLARLKSQDAKELKVLTEFVETGRTLNSDVYFVGRGDIMVINGYRRNNMRTILTLEDGTITANKARVQHLLKPIRKLAKREGYKLVLNDVAGDVEVMNGNYVLYRHFSGLGDLDDSNLFKDKVRPIDLREAPQPARATSFEQEEHEHCCYDCCDECDEDEDEYY